MSVEPREAPASWLALCTSTASPSGRARAMATTPALMKLAALPRVRRPRLASAAWPCCSRRARRRARWRGRAPCGEALGCSVDIGCQLRCCQAALGQRQDAVAEAGDQIVIVACHEHGYAHGVEAFEQPHDLQRQFGIKVAGGFVCNQERRDRKSVV